MNDDVPEKIREVLKLWDDHHISRGEFACRVQELFFDPVAWLEKGETIMKFGSCCCPNGHSPDRTFKVKITVQPHGYTVKRCGSLRIVFRRFWSWLWKVEEQYNE